MGWHITPRQQTAVDLGVQGFDTTVEHFRETRPLRHFGDRQTGLNEQLSRATSRDQTHAQLVQLAGQLDDAGFVRDGE